MSRVNQAEKEINLNLTSDIESANFKDASVKFAVCELIPKLIQTGDLEYLTLLASHELIYKEEIFWDQISRWKQLAFQKDRQAEKCLKAVVLGFIKCVRSRSPSRKRPSRPKMPILPDDLKEYPKLKNKLTNYCLVNADLQELKNL